MSQFACKRLKHVVALQRIRASDDAQSPYVGLENIESWMGRLSTVPEAPVPSESESEGPSSQSQSSSFETGDILFGKLRPYLAKAWVATFAGRCTTEALVMRASGVHPRFLLYALLQQSFIKTVDSSTFGSKMPRAEWEFIGSIPIPIPAPESQLAIANFLDRETARLDALVAAKQRVLALLAEKRKAIISTAVTRGLDPKAKLRDSGIPWLGEIPVHWSVARLKFLAAEPMAYGASEPSEFAIPSHPRFIRITDIGEDGSLREDTFRSLEPEVATPYLLRCGDMLFARSGATVGKTFLFAGKDGSACFAGYLIRFRSNLERILPSFLSALAQSTYYWWCIREGSLQATIQNFSAEKYGDIVVAVPPLNDQHAIVDHIAHESAKLEAMRAATERTITLLKERRSALIAAAVTGQLDLEAAK